MSNAPKNGWGRLKTYFLSKKKKRVDDDAADIRAKAREEIDKRSADMERALSRLQPITGLLISEEPIK